MTGMWKERPGHYLTLFVAGYALFFANLGGPSLWDLDEGRNATAAVEMYQSGNYIVPTFNAQLRVDKPVLLYWLQVASFQLFGINEYAVRFASALAALATLFSCYELGRALFSPSTGLLGGLMLGSTAMMTGAGHFANPDALLNLFISLALTIFWCGYARFKAGDEEPAGLRPAARRPGFFWFTSMGIILGLGVLTKGPVAVLLPGLIVGVFLVWEKRLKLLWNRHLLSAFIALALVALPWYIWVAVETHGQFLVGFFWDHNFNRFLAPMDRHDGPPFYYLIVLLVGTAPWSIFILLVAWYSFWPMLTKAGPRWQRYWQSAHDGSAGTAAYRFLGVWLVCTLVFFSLAATKLPNYLLPAALPMALFTACFFDRWRLGVIKPSRTMIKLGLVCVAAAGVVIGVAMGFLSGIFSAVTLFRGPFLHELRFWTLIGLAPLAAGLAALWCLRKGRCGGVVVSLLVGNILLIIPLMAWVAPAWNKLKAPRSLVNATGVNRQDQDLRIGGFDLEYLPSLNFYAKREVFHHMSDAEALAFLRYQVPVYLFMTARNWEGLKDRAPAQCRLIAHHADFYRSNEIVVVANQPAP